MVTGISEKQQQARIHSLAIIEKNQKLRLELDSKINELDVNTEQEKQMVCDFLPLFFLSFVDEDGLFGHLCFPYNFCVIMLSASVSQW
jgi:hypothetical protein